MWCALNRKDQVVRKNYSNVNAHTFFVGDRLQPGPVFFLTPRKCAIFGVHCEAFPRQVNFLCDEVGDCGKGSNTVVSQLHFFFKHHGLSKKGNDCNCKLIIVYSTRIRFTVHATHYKTLAIFLLEKSHCTSSHIASVGETDVFLRADNCTGQNKNNYVLWYLLWRAITGRHTNITLSFLVVGHTQFACSKGSSRGQRLAVWPPLLR